jgi:hypothetical protein
VGENIQKKIVDVKHVLPYARLRKKMLITPLKAILYFLIIFKSCTHEWMIGQNYKA